jgi:hypothetical protein
MESIVKVTLLSTLEFTILRPVTVTVFSILENAKFTILSTVLVTVFSTLENVKSIILSTVLVTLFSILENVKFTILKNCDQGSRTQWKAFSKILSKVSFSQQMY